MHIFIEKENRKLSMDFSGKAGALLKELSINPETVLIVKNGAVITEKDDLGKDDDIRLLSVVSGG